MKKRKGFYSISVVAKMFSVHQQTIRMYEKEGLLNPKRTEGNTRLFSEEDVERLEEIINLTHKMGVNLAGVDIILKLQKKLGKMQQDINKLFKQLDGDIVTQKEALKAGVKQQVTRLAEIKNDNPTSLLASSEGDSESKKLRRTGTLAKNIIEDIEFEDEDEEAFVKPVKKSARRSSTKKGVDEKNALTPNPNDWQIDYDDE